MALKKLKPTTSSTRHAILIDKSELWKGKPEKSLTYGITKTGGRNSTGRTTAWRKSGGNKTRYRIIDFHRFDSEAEVMRIEYDPNRSAFIALLQNKDGSKSYVIAPNKLKAGDMVKSGSDADIKIGNTLMLKNIPVGTIIHNVEIKPGKGAQIARSAGNYAQLVGRDQDKSLVKLPSGEIIAVFSICKATIGTVSNSDNQNVILGKAGRNRWLGVKPSVRGIAMNPVDHPHGGRTNGGRHPVTPWGVSTKGKKTRKKPLSKNVIKRRTK